MGPSILASATLIAFAADPPRSHVAHASAPVPHHLVGDHAAIDAVLVTASGGWPDTLAALLATLADRIDVYVVPQREAKPGTATRRLDRYLASFPESQRVRLHRVATEVDSPWVRDYGPLQTRASDQTIRWLDPQYVERPRDDALPSVLAHMLGVSITALPWSLDGGALASDGAGFCVATFDYFSTHAIPWRGPLLEGEIMPAIGCETLVFVPGLVDEATGHIDLIAQFVSPTTLAIASVDPALDPDQATRLDETADAIAAASERSLRIVRVPMGIDLSGDLLTYVNGLRVGDAFLLPSYHEPPSPTETRAAEAIESAVEGLAVIRIPAAQMTDLGGALHCAALGLTLPQSQPRPNISQ